MSTAVAIREDDRQLVAQRQIMTQRTPEHEIRTRPGRGGKPLKYTDGAYVIRTLNEAFGWDWDFVADNEELLLNNGEPFEVKVRGTLTVRLNGQAVTKTQFGCQPIEMLSNGTKPVSIGDAYKGAATDAMKKCASLLGIALDLYDSDSEVNTGKPKPPPPPVQQQQRRPEPPPWAGTACHEDPEPAPSLAPTEWPNVKKYNTVFAKLKALKWTHGQLANEIYTRFKLAVSDDNPELALDALNSTQLKELDQALAGEFRR